MNKYLKYPETANSLHRPELERDRCGVGVVAHIKGQRSYRVLRLGLDSVSNVTHRGAVNSDGKKGDGAGHPREGAAVGPLGLCARPTRRLFRRYFTRWGFLDGWQGFAAARINAFETFIRRAKVREFQQNYSKIQNNRSQDSYIGAYDECVPLVLVRF